MFVIELTYTAARGLAEFRVIEFRASRRARDLPERIA